MELCVQFFFTFLLLVCRVGSQNFQFAFDIYRVVSAETPLKNVVVSPLSVETALGLLLLGAGGNTKKELLNGLHYPVTNVSDITSYFYRLNQNNKLGSALVMANKIYTKQGYQFNPKFQNIAQEVFNSETETINFADSVNTAKAINFWINQRTGGRIPDLFRLNQFGPATRMVLVNALYFKDLWKQPFNIKGTQKRQFWVGGTRPVMTDMMYNHMEIEYGDIPELDAQVGRLPYQTPGWSMLIILPNKLTGLPELEQKLSDYDFSGIANRLVLRMVDVSLPKLKIESTINLKYVLGKLGIVELFSENANLANILLTPERQTVDTAIHKASVEIDEEGTVAAAATGFGVIALSASPTLVANHPFLFVILGPETVPLIGGIRTV